MVSRAEILAMADRYEQLERYQDALLDALGHVQNADDLRPSDMTFSHHAEMELSECLLKSKMLCKKFQI